MRGVRLSGDPTNSTIFTECCRVAICNYEKKCPRCGEEIIPADRRWDYAYGPYRKKEWTK